MNKYIIYDDTGNIKHVYRGKSILLNVPDSHNYKELTEGFDIGWGDEHYVDMENDSIESIEENPTIIGDLYMNDDNIYAIDLTNMPSGSKLYVKSGDDDPTYYEINGSEENIEFLNTGVYLVTIKCFSYFDEKRRIHVY